MDAGPRESLGLPDWDQSPRSVFGQWFSQLLFWLGAALPFALLSRLRKQDADRREQAIRDRRPSTSILDQFADALAPRNSILIEEYAAECRRLKGMFNRVPWCAATKDTSGNFTWANLRWLEDDLGITAEELSRMNGGRGATDIDLYGEEFGQKFREADAVLLADARALLEQQKDPAELVDERFELHYSPGPGSDAGCTSTKRRF